MERKSRRKEQVKEKKNSQSGWLFLFAITNSFYLFYLAVQEANNLEMYKFPITLNYNLIFLENFNTRTKHVKINFFTFFLPLVLSKTKHSLTIFSLCLRFKRSLKMFSTLKLISMQ